VVELLQGLLSLVAFAAYLLPTMVAALGNKRKTGPIFLLNLLLGWTVLGWIGALAWAFMDQRAALPAPAPWEAPVPVGAIAAEPALPSSPASPWPFVADVPASAPARGDRIQLPASRILRVGPDITAPSTGELRAGTDVTVEHSGGEWIRVRTGGGQEGWIRL